MRTQATITVPFHFLLDHLISEIEKLTRIFQLAQMESKPSPETPEKLKLLSNSAENNAFLFPK